MFRFEESKLIPSTDFVESRQHLERQAYARGLRAAARKARREAKEYLLRLENMSYLGHNAAILAENRYMALKNHSRWCDRRARAVERGK